MAANISRIIAGNADTEISVQTMPNWYMTYVWHARKPTAVKRVLPIFL